MRSISKGDEVTVRLLCSKSKVAPLKPTTIPRLELCAAGLSARLCKQVLESIRFVPTRVVHWSDSSVVLAWINSNPNKLKTYVANRIGEIQELTSPQSWRYVPTKSNPADLISRGLNGSQLPLNDLWWCGPDFLLRDESQWPKLNKKYEEDLPEVKLCPVGVSALLRSYWRDDIPIAYKHS
ncbi:unnamed protein product [Colias eurytheme]|nr:unnamed protein product [Colias eurytheme]